MDISEKPFNPFADLKYHLIAGTAGEVQQGVQSLLQQGWQLAGNLAVVYDVVGDAVVFAQGMTRSDMTVGNS